METTIEQFMEGATIIEVKQDRSFKDTYFIKNGKKYVLGEPSWGSRFITECRY